MSEGINQFTETIQKIRADPLASSLQRLPTIKGEIIELRDRVADMTKDETEVSSDELTCLSEVDEQITVLEKLFSDGVTISTDTVGRGSKVKALASPGSASSSSSALRSPSLKNAKTTLRKSLLTETKNP